ncbi:MAG: methyltransferase domain-containing protein [Chloroflexota bacterium]
MEAPDDFMEAWAPRAAPGRALDLGAGRGQVAHWLARRGFQVDAVERSWPTYVALRWTCRGLPVRPLLRDIRSFAPEPAAYNPIAALAVLHFLPSTALAPLCRRLSEALIPGGLIVVTAFSTDDPGLAPLKAAGSPELDPNTYRVPPPIDTLHFFKRGELAGLFAGLEVLAEEPYRWLGPTSPAGHHAGIRFAARRPDSPGV